MIELFIYHLLCVFQDLIQTDHEKIYYRPFRKDFYIEVPEIARMTVEGNDSGDELALRHSFLL